jgi:cytochrome c
VSNFEYSDANKNSGIVWNEETFPGIKNEQQVKDLWAYISQFESDGNIKK